MQMGPFKTAFITGAAQGLGKAFSEALLMRGARVCIVDIQTENGLQVERDFQNKYGKDSCIFLQCDVTSPSNLNDTFKTAVSKFGYIDLLVNNAGIINENKAETTITINLLGVIRGSMLAVDHMRKDHGGKGGTIINIASRAGVEGIFLFPVYCASKFGVVGFHHSCASNPHLREMGIQFGCLCPAFTDTAILNDTLNNTPYMKSTQKLMTKMGINKVESVVKAFMQLVDSPNCNGDIISVRPEQGIEYYTKGRVKWTSRL